MTTSVSESRRRLWRLAGTAIVTAILLVVAGNVSGAGTNALRMSDEQCLGCHAGSAPTYSRKPNTQEQESPWVRHPYLDIRSMRASVHGKLDCIDCHVEGFDTAPHVRSREKVLDCIACHSSAGHARFAGLAAKDAGWHFARIDREFRASAHFTKHPNQFLCSDCHHPHYFMTTAGLEAPARILDQENGWCLSCHAQNPTGPADIIDWSGLLDPAAPSLAAEHRFLPHAAVHLRAVRCTACHADPDEQFSHRLLTGPAATGCTDCHAGNSAQAALYRHVEAQAGAAFTNAAVARDTYVMAATRNKPLDVLAYLVIGLALLGVAAHGLSRVARRWKDRRRNRSGAR